MTWGGMPRIARRRAVLRMLARPTPTPSARRQPEVLHRAAGAVDIGLGDAVATEDLAPARRIAGDAHIERRLNDAFQLQREVVRAARFVV